jgi:hypothetical protein
LDGVDEELATRGVGSTKGSIMRIGAKSMNFCVGLILLSSCLGQSVQRHKYFELAYYRESHDEKHGTNGIVKEDEKKRPEL